MAIPFAEVLKEERREIDYARTARDTELEKAKTPRGIEALRSQFVGLAFSGGGIRSATFNLGVLQGLAELGLLPIIDYLSTVSGGGYIGTWLTAWINRDGFCAVEKALKSARPSGDGLHDPHQHRKNEPKQIRWLREYSNYLTPKLGIASGDTWAFIGAYVRNLILNQLILGLVLIALLFVPRVVVAYFWKIDAASSPWIVAAIAAVLLCVALGSTLANLSSQAQDGRAKKDVESVLATSGWIIGLVVVPTLLGLWLLWAWFWAQCGSWKTYQAAIASGLSFFAIWLLGWVGGEYVRALVAAWREEAAKERVVTEEIKTGKLQFAASVATSTFTTRRFRVLKIIGWAIPAGVVGGALLTYLTHVIQAHHPEHNSVRIEMYGFAMVVGIFLFMESLHIGLAGREFTEDAREWWGRLCGVLTLASLYVTALFAISIDGPQLIPWLVTKHYSWVSWLLGVVWAGITGSGLLVGKSNTKTNADAGITPSLIAKIAPPVFVIGLLLLLSQLAEKIYVSLGNLSGRIHNVLATSPSIGFQNWPEAMRAFGVWSHRVSAALELWVWWWIALFFLTALFLSWREGINRFSMHSLYRNRLVRCYLGASNRDRRPQPFIGMDPEDDSVQFGELLHTQQRDYSGPYPIYNTALNMVSGDELAWQQRKAASFIFSPLCSGFEYTETDGKTVSGLQVTRPLNDKLKLGLAMAISGAAAAPNMGAHSTPGLAFLLTVFNVRLGWWLGNPHIPEKWGRMGPRVGLFYLFNEMMGNTKSNSNYVYLSDGGHFENLGIYELVRRHCRFIIVCDSGEDHQMHFEDLGNAIEKCRTDFGVDIEIDVAQLRRQSGSNLSKWHCAVGTIHYEKVNETIPAGTLLYLKSSLTGDEPTDVQHYADDHPEFPHETTADQWFTESQFESYRALGHHIAEAAIGVMGDEKEIGALGVEGLFVKLRQHWYPPSQFVAQSFTKHTATYASLLEKQRADKTLQFLDSQVYPEWPSLMEKPNQARRAGIWLPDDPAERRAGFYFCNQVIQLMEDAYLDLNLEADFDHPDNRGWMNLFRHWSWSGMFAATWAISAGIYGARFQNFCARRLDLSTGTVGLATRPSPLRQEREAIDARLKPTLEAQRRWGVDFWEAELISTFEHERQRSVANDARERLSHAEVAGPTELFVLPFHVIVKSPRDEDRQELEFNVGFALLEMEHAEATTANVVFFRVQDHLRKMGLGRSALSALVRKYGFGLRNKVVAIPQPKDHGHLSSGASVLEAYPSPEAALYFNNLFASAQLRGGQSRDSSNQGHTGDRRGRHSGAIS